MRALCTLAMLSSVACATAQSAPQSAAPPATRSVAADELTRCASAAVVPRSGEQWSGERELTADVRKSICAVVLPATRAGVEIAHAGYALASDGAVRNDLALLTFKHPTLLEGRADFTFVAGLTRHGWSIVDASEALDGAPLVDTAVEQADDHLRELATLGVHVAAEGTVCPTDGGAFPPRTLAGMRTLPEFGVAPGAALPPDLRPADVTIVTLRSVCDSPELPDVLTMRLSKGKLVGAERRRRFVPLP